MTNKIYIKNIEELYRISHDKKIIKQYVKNINRGHKLEEDEELDANEAIQILATYLLGPGFYIADSVNGKRANAIIVNYIMKSYNQRLN